MDLSELNSTHAADKSQPSGSRSGNAAPADGGWLLANQIGVEVACALTPALDSALQMRASGRIDRAGLHTLVTQIEQARQASMLGQQIARWHGGIQQQPEAVICRTRCAVTYWRSARMTCGLAASRVADDQARR